MWSKIQAQGVFHVVCPNAGIPRFGMPFRYSDSVVCSEVVLIINLK